MLLLRCCCAGNQLPRAAFFLLIPLHFAQVYEGLSYKLSVAFSEKYPYEAPTVKFVTACFHPNVDMAGNICLDILKDKWSAAFSVRTVLMSLQTLLGDPNNDSPLNSYAAQLWESAEEYKVTLHKKYSEAAEVTPVEAKA